MTVLRSALPVLAAAGLAGACTTPPPHSIAALTPTEQFSIEVRSTIDEIHLAPHGRLSPAQGLALADMAERWRDAGEGPIVIHAAPGGDGPGTAHAAAHALQSAGVPAEMIRIAAPEAGVDAGPGPVRIGYSRLVAVGPQCANLWTNLTHTGSNLPQPSFGCAVTANLAAQIADPRDLVAPRASYPADAGRRAIVLGKYRQGEKTGASRDADERGDVGSAKK